MWLWIALMMALFFMFVSGASSQTIPFNGSNQIQNLTGQQNNGQQGGGSQQQGSNNSQGSNGQQGGSVAALTATTINNGYSQGSQIRVGGTSVRLNLRLLPQSRQQITTYRQYRLNLRLGRHGFIQTNNNGGTTGGATTGGATTGGTTGGGTTGGATTGGTTGGGGSQQGGGSGQGGEIPTGAVGMQATTPR